VDEVFQLSVPEADRLAEIPLRCVEQEYPNAPQLLLNDPSDLKTPRELHPAFYGCLDWHSAVHMYWTLVSLLRRFPLAKEGEIRSLLNRHLTAENLRIEADYFRNRPSFERPYGWGWLLMLASALRTWDNADAKRWSANLEPLEGVITELVESFLAKQTYPIRTGTHGNTAFALILARSYAVDVNNQDLLRIIDARSMDYYQSDREKPAPLSYEPGGNDFLSPALVEAKLISEVLGPEDFAAWFAGFVPDPTPILIPAIVSDRSDGQIAHLDGLNLSRAWCLRSLLPHLADSPHYAALEKSLYDHAEEGLASLQTGHYEGEHWLASFAMLLHSVS